VSRLPYLCVDSSVAFKWFCSEQETSVAEALELFHDHITGSVQLVAPAHLPAEVLSALERRSGITTEHLVTASQALAESEIAYPAWDAPLLEAAAVLARKHGLTFYDALFPALAAELGCGLVTADRAQARASECPIRLRR